MTEGNSVPVGWTPSTDRVRKAATGFGRVIEPGEFDRWVSVHDALVAAKALRDAADEIKAMREQIATAQMQANRGYLTVVPGAVVAGYQQAEGLVEKRADRIEGEAMGCG